MGLFTVSGNSVYWVELIIIQILVPNASFLGHLCGILAGLLCKKRIIIFHPIQSIPFRCSIPNILVHLDTNGYLEPIVAIADYIPDILSPSPPGTPTRSRYRGDDPQEYPTYRTGRRVVRNGGKGCLDSIW